MGQLPGIEIAKGRPTPRLGLRTQRPLHRLHGVNLLTLTKWVSDVFGLHETSYPPAGIGVRRKVPIYFWNSNNFNDRGQRGQLVY